MNVEKNTILIVDDEKANIIALTHILGPDYAICAAKNGRDAVELAKKHKPDVILLDIIMPDMDGYEVLGLLKRDEATSEIPVIFLTGLVDADDEEKGLSIGASDYINKPFRPTIIKLRVQHHVRMVNQLQMIRRLSMTDQLTDIPNRRSFDYRLGLEWNHAKRCKWALTILLIDIDNFKTYNDTYGHLQGDAALQAVAAALNTALKRSGDFIARWGGEEFVALLPSTDAAGAYELAENLRQTMAQTPIPCDDKAAEYITVSIGINTVAPTSESSPDDFINDADRALYQAKQTGRNRVCVAPEKEKPQ